MNFKNFMEDVVNDVYQEFKVSNPQYCDCPRCMNDIIAFTLTRLRGKYAVSPEGEILARISCEDRQVRTDALVALIEAAEQVAKQPNHSE